MTTNIMNKISAALSLKSSFESTANHSNSNKIDEQDEYHTLFTKRLLNDTSMNSTTRCSTNDEVDHYNHQSACSLDDFIGGPIDEEHSFSLQSKHPLHDQSIDFNRSITATPADSSCGFHNTFSVLEKHLNKNKYLRLSQKQIEHLLLQNKNLTVHNDNYIDIPIMSDDGSLHAVNEFVNSSMNDTYGWNVNDEESPSHLELELEAMERLRSMWTKEGFDCDKNDNADERESLYTPCDTSLIEELYQQDSCSDGVPKSNEYIYHVAKRNDQLYIRVRRNLRLDQGKIHFTHPISIYHNFFLSFFVPE